MYSAHNNRKCVKDLLEPSKVKFIIFLDSTELKIVWKKIATFFFKRRLSIILSSFSS